MRVVGQSDLHFAFIGLHTGGHGVPIRMIDCREALNWFYGQTR
jgi:hypothetical protein